MILKLDDDDDDDEDFYVPNMTGLVLNMTKFVLNKMGVVPNIL